MTEGRRREKDKDPERHEKLLLLLLFTRVFKKNCRQFARGKDTSAAWLCSAGQRKGRRVEEQQESSSVLMFEILFNHQKKRLGRG